MTTVERLDYVADILASAPAWARQALTSSDPRVRARGAETVSAFLLRKMDAPAPVQDDNQLTLPILA